MQNCNWDCENNRYHDGFIDGYDEGVSDAMSLVCKHMYNILNYGDAALAIDYLRVLVDKELKSYE